MVMEAGVLKPSYDGGRLEKLVYIQSPTCVGVCITRFACRVWCRPRLPSRCSRWRRRCLTVSVY